MRERIIAVLTLLLLAAAPISAEPAKDKPNKAKDKEKHSSASGGSTAIDIDIVFGEYRRIVRDYMDHPPGGSLPPGLAKRGHNLPPGHEKQLRKNGTLPPGLQKRLAPYPSDLAKRLPDLGEDYGGGFLHGRVVVFNKRTSAILDVIVP